MREIEGRIILWLYTNGGYWPAASVADGVGAADGRSIFPRLSSLRKVGLLTRARDGWGLTEAGLREAEALRKAKIAAALGDDDA